jgi:hypothetical protein
MSGREKSEMLKDFEVQYAKLIQLILPDALKGAINSEHVHWMSMVDTCTLTLDEL